MNILFAAAAGAALASAHDQGLPTRASTVDDTLSLRLLTDPSSVLAGAVCLDGSPAGYYYRSGVGANASRFLVSLVGTGWCTSLLSCEERARTAIGSSKTWDTEVSGYGIANSSAEHNPTFSGWSVAYVNSCDGAFFLGAAPSAVGGLYFRGRYIVDAVIADLVRRDGLGRAASVLLTGDSSGGLAAALSVDRVAALLPDVADVRALVDGGFFLDRPHNGGDRASLEPIMALAAVNVSGCGGGWECASLPHTLPRIARPLLLTQSLYDYAQLGSDGEDLGCTPPGTANTSSLPECDAEGMARFWAFGAAMSAQLAAAVDGAPVQHRGAFGVACIAHSLTEYGRYLDGGEYLLLDSPEWEVPASSGRTVARAVSDWYEGREDARHIDGGSWPANRPCAWLGLP
jgi:hypothetical protein